MIFEFDNKRPKVDPTAFIAENAVVIGDVHIESGANIWFQSIVDEDIRMVQGTVREYLELKEVYRI